MVAIYSYILVFVLYCNLPILCDSFHLFFQPIHNLHPLEPSNRFYQTRHNACNRKTAMFSISPKATPSWEELSGLLPSEELIRNMATKSIDSALDAKKPDYSKSHPTLFRERHGWCPYSERAWLTVEYKNIPYDTIRIDNTGPGAKPSYYSGQTPQIRWEDGRMQGESMDIVFDLDKKSYPSPSLDAGVLYDGPDVEEKIKAWKQIFPRGARPSSRAAYLFSWNGDPLPKSEFQRVLSETDNLLQSTKGPFFCGSSFTAADIAWVPFLERYAAQLPCLHSDLNPKDENTYPYLYRWYEAIQNQIPAYACRVKGDSSSWRKVLGMAGYGNMGNVPFDIKERMTKQNDKEVELFLSPDDHAREMKLWMEYRVAREYLAESPSAEAAAIVFRNRNAIVTDIEKRVKFTKEWKEKLPLQKENGLDNAMRTLIYLLLQEGKSMDDILAIQDDIDISLLNDVGMLAAFLDERMCVPRDMGEMSAAAIKRIATRLNQ